MKGLLVKFTVIGGTNTQVLEEAVRFETESAAREAFTAATKSMGIRELQVLNVTSETKTLRVPAHNLIGVTLVP